MTGLAENERRNIRQRQKEGIEAARLRGVQFGRPPKPVPEKEFCVDFQKETAVKLGLPVECFYDGRKQNAGQWIRENTSGIGADVVFECVGKNETINLSIESAAPAGRICLIGNPCTDMLFDKQLYWKILRNQIILTGIWNSSFTGEADDDWHYVIKLIKDKTE